MRFTVIRTETVERNYECERCGTRGTTWVRGRGSSSYNRGLLVDDAMQGREDAAMAMQHDATRVLTLIKCPSCELRAPHALSWSIGRLAVSLVPALIVAAGGGAVAVYVWGWPPWVAPILAGLAVVAGFWREVGRWREAGRAHARLTNLKPGSPDKTLPKAIARPRLPSAPPAPDPVVPVASVAPPRDPEPPAPGEGPRFLRDK